MNIQPIQSGAAYQMTAAGKTQAVRGPGSAEGPEQAGRLQKRLSQLENELRQKDNDTYRRAHAVIS